MQYVRLYYKIYHYFLELINVNEKIDVSNCLPLENSIYYCCNYDINRAPLTTKDSETQIANIFPNLVWNHLANDHSSIFIYESSRETISIPWLTLQLRYLTNQLNIKQCQIYIVLPDEIHTNRLTEMLSYFNMENINVDFYNMWLYSVNIKNKND